MGLSKYFEKVEIPNLPRSRFDWRHSVRGTYDMGILYPVQCDILMPGAVVDYSIENVVRAMPLVAPIMDTIKITYHVWKCPIRVLDENFPEFVTGGEDGSNAYTMPRWEPTNYARDSLWDHMGNPAAVDPDGFEPLEIQRTMYNLTYNEHYRDQNLITEVSLTSEDLQRRAYSRDYFNAASPVQQKGTAPAFPISGNAPIDSTSGTGNTSTANNISVDTSANTIGDTGNKASIDAAFAKMTADLSVATTFTLNDFRLVAVVQQYMELMQRTGARYPEYLKALFKQEPRDLRLQRPELVGGMVTPLFVSEVLQTGESGTTPQGNLAGHGISRGNASIGKVKAEEWCVLMTLMSIMPENVYNAQGVNRQWVPETKEEWYNPLFAHLAEQPIYRGELYASGVEAENKTVFGYQGNGDHWRFKLSRTAGKMRDDFDEWTLARQFSSAPLLNQSFIECDPENRMSAVPSEPAFIVNTGFNMYATLPMPAMASPGLRRI